MSNATLTEHLLSLQRASYAAATQHPFLTQAGNGTLPLARLAFWLSQDRIYAAHAYPRFIGSLISRIPFQQTDTISGSNEHQNQDILKVLVSCLDNIVREISFFEDTAQKFGMDMEGWVERKGTRDYTAEMSRVASTGSLEEGLVFLWAMEQVYFEAWTNVRITLDSNDSVPLESTPAVREFSANWSSPEFAAFVKALANLVNKLNIFPGTDAWRRAEAVWLRVVELEIGFWPEEGEESHMKKTL
ncbi:hypothetical protein CVT25_010572 [Psilocybe cyanescens]|uniref:Thiaminase-2/PQQC domain-containing protein n=1 Tax=Psilocybe cyanescens TaxID=93625 RepID=A0A409WJA6_PSICY|nr:hypothetical protein CVT25_010572 [Psilocybe cyanescens]